MSEYYGVSTPSSDFLFHYGVKGMKWGVRRFADDYGRPTKKFEKLYGSKSEVKIRPLTMQRHFNQLDKSYAKIAAKKRAKEIEMHDMYLAKDRVQKRAKKNPKVLEKYNKAMAKALEKGINRTVEARNIESMMDAIAAKAANSGYTVKSKSVVRMPYTMVRGRGIGVMPVSGQRIKIRKNGNGQVNFTMYKEHGDGTPYNVNFTKNGAVSARQKTARKNVKKHIKR